MGVSNESFFCRNDLFFLLDLKKREVELYNRVELMEKYYNELKETGYSSSTISDYNNVFKSSLALQSNLVSHLLWFHNAKIQQDNTIQNSTLKDKLVVNEKKDKSFKIGSKNSKGLTPGKLHEKFWVDVESGMITNYNAIKLDSIKNKYGEITGDFLYNVWETNYTLKLKKRIIPNTIIVSGRINNSLGKKIYFRYLDDLFGIRMKKETVFIDKNGNFEYEINFQHGGFIYANINYPSQTNRSVDFLFYAEPGDTIHFEVEDINQPDKINYLGSRIEEAALLQMLKTKFNILKGGRMLDTETNIVYDTYTGFLRPNDLDKNETRSRIEAIIFELSQVENIIADNKEKLDQNSYQYINNEIKNYYYNVIFSYLSAAINKERNKVIVGQYINYYVKIENFLKSIDIHASYNDFGINSRKSVSNYLAFHYNKIGNTGSKGMYFRSSSFISDIEQHIQFSRILLSGSLLYREIGGLIQVALTSPYIIPFEEDKPQIEVIAYRNLDLFIRRCNDVLMLEKAKNLLNQYNQIQNSYQIPNIKVFDINQTSINLKDHYIGKPTIFYFLSGSFGWAGERYKFDELAKENPELNFVLIGDGNSFREWKEYTERAEPIAIQLFMPNDSISIKDLILKSSIFLTCNKKGELVGYSKGINNAVKQAKTTLEPKKRQLNKSQLLIIVVILVAFLTILIIGLFIWKWRVWQRFRKEQQQRRLRELELTAIRSQMNPHFLFNSLNSVQNLVQQNKSREAHLYLSDFAGLIRKVLQNSEKEEVSLAEELEMTEQYLNLEKLRFDFDFSITVDNKIDQHNTLVPSMLLQPFVENAVIHGLQTKTKDRQLKVEVWHVESGIKISIEDNGIGREAAKEITKAKNGKGSKLIRERLNILQEKQGEKYLLEIFDLKGTEVGTRVVISIPEEI